MPYSLWLIGGTSESAKIAQVLAQFQIPCLVTVVTEAARSLYPQAPELRVQVGRLNLQGIPAFLQRESIVAILDASHPHAAEISQLAIATANQYHIPYLRYERPQVETSNASPLITELASFDELLTGNYLTGQRVFLSVGYQTLPRFQVWQARATLFTRILPSVTALEAALGAGFSPDRVIAMRPPIPAGLERELWRFWHISLVVTKASGSPGGEAVKRQVAAELGIPLVAIARPQLDYPRQTSDLAVAIEFCRHWAHASVSIPTKNKSSSTKGASE